MAPGIYGIQSEPASGWRTRVTGNGVHVAFEVEKRAAVDASSAPRSLTVERQDGEPGLRPEYDRQLLRGVCARSRWQQDRGAYFFSRVIA